MKDTLRRPTDYLFRLCGEEFGVLISDLDDVKAVYMAEKLRQNVQELKIEHVKNKASSVLTISIGLLTLLPDKDTDHEEILKRLIKTFIRQKKRVETKS